jgi:bisphosphoglycerate-independent phosphoglycerate mutase (AlkP superfamily)
MKDKLVALIILDGFGVNPKEDVMPLRLQKTNLDRYFSDTEYSHNASGMM